jgi:hypothetical protein
MVYSKRTITKNKKTLIPSWGLIEVDGIEKVVCCICGNVEIEPDLVCGYCDSWMNEDLNPCDFCEMNPTDPSVCNTCLTRLK